MQKKQYGGAGSVNIVVGAVVVRNKLILWTKKLSLTSIFWSLLTKLWKREERKSKYCCCHPPSGGDWLITMFVKTEEGIKTTTLGPRRRLAIASRSSVEGSFETENLIYMAYYRNMGDNWHWWRISMNSPAAPSHPRKASTKRAVYETCPRLEWASKHAGFTTIWQKKACFDFVFRFCFSPNMFLDNLAYLLWSSGKLANLETQDFPHKGSLQRRDSGPRILNSLSDWELFSNPLSPRKYNSYIFIYLFSRGKIFQS